MAKKASKPAVVENQVDDLLDETSEATATEATATEETPAAEKTAEEIEAEELQAKIKALQKELRDKKAILKGEQPKKERVLKGKLVAFKNKAGETITGLGVLYYVTRSGGKLHYKEASQVTVLPEDWKEGDAIPELASAPEAETEETLD